MVINSFSSSPQFKGLFKEFNKTDGDVLLSQVGVACICRNQMHPDIDIEGCKMLWLTIFTGIYSQAGVNESVLIHSNNIIWEYIPIDIFNHNMSSIRNIHILPEIIFNVVEIISITPTIYCESTYFRTFLSYYLSFYLRMSCLPS